MKFFNIAMLALLIIGGFNWGLVGAAQIDLVAILFGPGTAITNVIYVLVGVAAIYCCIFFKYVSQTPDDIGINRGE